MADDYQYINRTGTIVPDTSVLLTETQDEFKAVFGADLVVTPDSPQGVLITAETLVKTSVVNNNAAVANQINPNIAGGIFLDAIMALTGIQRTPATRTTVSGVELTGAAGTVISQNTQAKTAAGDVFFLTSAVTLDGTGNGLGNFASLEYGVIPCAIGELDTIVSAVLGWETVNNPVAGVVGATTQSDQAARALRNNTLGFQGVALAVAITSSLYAVEGVKSLTFRENVENTTQTIDGISMVAKSIYACVDGGTDTDVAAALLENKSSGCNWNGTTTVNVIEPASGQSYAVKFSRPTAIPVLIKVTTTNGNAADIKAAVLAYINGEINGEAGFVVGADVSPFEMMAGISRDFPSFYIKKIEVKYTLSGSFSTDDLLIEIDEIATAVAASISVVIV